MADAWGGSWGVAWGSSWTSSGTTPPVVVVTKQKRPGPYWGAQKYVLPPGWKKKKPSIEEVKKLYVEVRATVPPQRQQGLLPVRYRTEGRSTARLPPARLVDFAKLRDDLSALGKLLGALGQVAEEKTQLEAQAREAQAQAILKRRREEETIIYLLLNF